MILKTKLNKQKLGILNNFSIKILALICGYLLWTISAKYQEVELKLNIPVAFYNVPENIKLDSISNINITLLSKRLDLYNLDLNNLAIHVNYLNLSNFSIDKTLNLKISPEQLFLPKSVNLKEYFPNNIIIKIIN